jgi:hypothetical protein
MTGTCYRKVEGIKNPVDEWNRGGIFNQLPATLGQSMVAERLCASL